MGPLTPRSTGIAPILCTQPELTTQPSKLSVPQALIIVTVDTRRNPHSLQTLLYWLTFTD